MEREVTDRFTTASMWADLRLAEIPTHELGPAGRALRECSIEEQLLRANDPAVWDSYQSGEQD